MLVATDTRLAIVNLVLFFLYLSGAHRGAEAPFSSTQLPRKPTLRLKSTPAATIPSTSIFSMIFLPLTLLAVLPSVLSAPAHGLVPRKQASRDVSNPASLNTTKDVLATGWYPSWITNEYPPEKISWSKYNAMTFAFGYVT